jgi:hypothetical protein
LTTPAMTSTNQRTTDTELQVQQKIKYSCLECFTK